MIVYLYVSESAILRVLQMTKSREILEGFGLDVDIELVVH